MRCYATTFEKWIIKRDIIILIVISITVAEVFISSFFFLINIFQHKTYFNMNLNKHVCFEMFVITNIYYHYSKEIFIHSTRAERSIKTRISFMAQKIIIFFSNQTYQTRHV